MAVHDEVLARARRASMAVLQTAAARRLRIRRTYSLPLAEAADGEVREPVGEGAVQETIHTVISESEGAYVAECLEVAVVTQGDSLDETLRHLREAVGLFMSEEDPASLGLAANPRLSISFETTSR